MMEQAIEAQLTEGSRRWQNNEITLGEQLREYGLAMRYTLHDGERPWQVGDVHPELLTGVGPSRCIASIPETATTGIAAWKQGEDTPHE